MARLKEFLRGCESGQSLIFAAVMMSTLLAIAGVAIEGGHIFVEYRHMQSAADMAALTGAQKLPCKVGDSTCINTALQDACTYAQNNGFGGGWSGAAITSTVSCLTGSKSTGYGSTTTSVKVGAPPFSCSPYAFLDYGNNSSCPGRAASTLNQIVFLEVQIQEPITVPIFNVSFTLSAHAVAKQGISSPNDFAVSVLDPNNTGGLTMGGSGNVVVVGDTMSNGGVTVNGNGGKQISCDGSWYTAASQATPSNSTFVSNLSGSANFANADCTGGTTLNPASFFPDSPLIPDPYGDTPQPSGTNLDTTCPLCDPSTNAWYFDRNAKTWQQVGSSQLKLTNSDTYELFPGYYPGGIKADGGTIYLNPGVYTFGGGFSTNGGTTMCIYGAPACDELNSNIPGYTFGCATASFTSTDTNYIPSANWYYYCSPFGVWDTSNHDSRPAAVTTSAPYFYDPTSATKVPLNGVTFYMQSGASFNMNGNASMFVAFPNACPGTGTGGQSAGSNGQGGSVPFQGNPIGEPSGQADFGYTYPTSALPFVDSSGSITQSTNVTSSGGQKTQVYPSIDLSLDGEKLCENGLTTWQGEFPNKPNIGQHLQFLVFDDGTNNSISLNGAALQQWYGILHTFPQNYAGYPGPPTGSGCSGNCDISITGNGGAAQTGPPFLVGQSVSGTATFSGNGSVEIFYRPCKALKVPCGSGPGTALVQ